MKYIFLMINDVQVRFDMKTLKALASENRIKILKLLNIRKQNLTNLSQALSLPKSTIYRDLAILIESGLVNKIHTHRKWRYYELTTKGMLLF